MYEIRKLRLGASVYRPFLGLGVDKFTPQPDLEYIYPGQGLDMSQLLEYFLINDSIPSPVNEKNNSWAGREANLLARVLRTGREGWELENNGLGSQQRYACRLKCLTVCQSVLL